MFCVFREFCGSKYLCKSVKSVGEYSLPVCSVNSVNSVGGFNIGALSDMLVHFLLWQAAKPSGDKCTPWSVPLKLLQQERRLYAQIDAGSKTQLVVVAVHLVAYGEVVRGQRVENVSLHAPRESLAQFLRVAKLRTYGAVALHLEVAFVNAHRSVERIAEDADKLRAVPISSAQTEAPDVSLSLHVEAVSLVVGQQIARHLAVVSHVGFGVQRRKNFVVGVHVAPMPAAAFIQVFTWRCSASGLISPPRCCITTCSGK